METALREVVRRRQTQCFRKLPGPPSGGVASQQGGDYLGRRTGRQTHAYVSAIVSRGLPFRECVETEQDQKRRSYHYLSSEHSRSSNCDPGLRTHWRGAFGGLRRV